MKLMTCERQQLSNIVTLEKGKPPAQQPYFGHDAEIYLTPEYLRGKASAELVKPSVNAVQVFDGDTIVLWDGSNAGEFFRARRGILASTMSRISHNDTFAKEYFFYAVKSWEPFLKGQTSGSGIPHVDKEVLGKIEIFQFFKPEQAKIAEILSTVDRGIEQTEALIAKQQHMKTGLMQDLLTRGIDEHGNLRSEQTHQFKDSPLGRIPVEWNCNYLNQICTKITDGVHYTVRKKESGVPFLFVSCVREGEILFDNASYIDWLTYKMISKGCEPIPGAVLYTVVGSYGHAACITSNKEFGFERNIAFIVPKKDLLVSGYLAGWLNSPAGRKTADKYALGNAQKLISLSQLGNFEIPLPSIEEQDRIYKADEQVTQSIRSLYKMMCKLKKTKTALMQDLLTGKKRVTPLLEGREVVSG